MAFNFPPKPTVSNVMPSAAPTKKKKKPEADKMPPSMQGLTNAAMGAPKAMC